MLCTPPPYPPQSPLPLLHFACSPLGTLIVSPELLTGGWASRRGSSCPQPGGLLPDVTMSLDNHRVLAPHRFKNQNENFQLQPHHHSTTASSGEASGPAEQGKGGN